MAYKWPLRLQGDCSHKDFCLSIGPKNGFGVSSGCNNGDGEVLMQSAYFLCRFISYKPVIFHYNRGTTFDLRKKKLSI